MKKTLVILAAGMGSRFGGLKQIEPIGPSGEFIIDYSIYDAIKAGYNKVVFIIKKENYDIFKNTIGNRIKGIDVHYAFQENTIDGYEFSNDRTKPLGTAHALLALKNIVNEAFTVINADDYYGRESFVDAYSVLGNKDYYIVGYNVCNTLSENGTVKRGVCNIDNDKLISIDECIIFNEEDILYAHSLTTNKRYSISTNSVVSMNMMCLDNRIIDYIDNNIVDFFNENKEEDKTVEYLLPYVIEEMKTKGILNIYVKNTSAKWYGITYKEDKASFVNNINRMVKEGKYKNSLWN